MAGGDETPNAEYEEHARRRREMTREPERQAGFPESGDALHGPSPPRSPPGEAPRGAGERGRALYDRERAQGASQPAADAFGYGGQEYGIEAGDHRHGPVEGPPSAERVEDAGLGRGLGERRFGGDDRPEPRFEDRPPTPEAPAER